MNFKLTGEDGNIEYNAYTLFLILILLILSQNVLINMLSMRDSEKNLSILPAPAQKKKGRKNSEKVE